ncbi:hypothetical protein AV530_002550 [Patagioenas fasciata monilis]|uniref:Uncharacterized protein n=1 Tax=Patagioenas fasciata monilis TaxID=372326 RepID=A0A1V4K702_PATFA|nr:hypothetical protein AV530_002550 [Patagioenas fasciata monilis]
MRGGAGGMPGSPPLKPPHHAAAGNRERGAALRPAQGRTETQKSQRNKSLSQLTPLSHFQAKPTMERPVL